MAVRLCRSIILCGKVKRTPIANSASLLAHRLHGAVPRRARIQGSLSASHTHTLSHTPSQHPHRRGANPSRRGRMDAPPLSLPHTHSLSLTYTHSHTHSQTSVAGEAARIWIRAGRHPVAPAPPRGVRVGLGSTRSPLGPTGTPLGLGPTRLRGDGWGGVEHLDASGSSLPLDADEDADDADTEECELDPHPPP